MNHLSLLLIFCFIHSHTAHSSSCPINFDYVHTFPWDASLCHDPVQSGCCQTLRSLFGVGLAKHLAQTSTFYLPDADTSSSCMQTFGDNIQVSMAIPRFVFPACFNDTTEFVNNQSTSCAGIRNLQDWTQKLNGSVVPLESSCNGDLTGLTRCNMCMEAGLKANTYLVSQHPNSTKCFFFAVFYAAAVVNEFGPEDVRSASCILGLPVTRSGTKGSNAKTRKLVFGFVGGLIGTCTLLITLFIVYRKWHHKKKEEDMMHENYVSSVKSKVLPNMGAKWFNEAELEQATDGFSQKNMIGRGSFGIVYKGVLTDGTHVAVKHVVDMDMDMEEDDDFSNEAEIISRIRHRNLLPLRGFCITSDRFKGKRRYLVYDFMSNGSLNDHIFSHHHHLTWPQRKSIILDVAKGLAYLHHGIKPSIYHRDIKPTNILLDSEMHARVADFGLAKQTKEGQSHLTTRVAGTHGYMPPEYALYGQLTEKSDVYSFGMVILEIMSGRRVLDPSEPSKMLITDWGWGLVKAGRVEEVVDESIREEGAKGIMERYVRVGILCGHVMVALRPTIADALKMLEGDVDIPPLPDRPLPLSHEMLQMSFRSPNQTPPEGGNRTEVEFSVNRLNWFSKCSLKSNRIRCLVMLIGT